jgi:two-component system sensor histidine kinase UhpB
MSLIQTLMRRAALTMAVCLCVALALALWRAQIDTDREARGSAHIARMVSALSSLQSVPQADLAAHLQTIQALNASGGLRHVQLRIQDASGRRTVPLRQRRVFPGCIPLAPCPTGACSGLFPDRRGRP